MNSRIETGIIEEIVDVSENERTNKIVMLKLSDKEAIAVQFQGKNASLLDRFKPKMKVSVMYLLKAKKSARGKFYNNLIGESIKSQNDFYDSNNNIKNIKK